MAGQVMVAMSGGVDSSVAAALLEDAGYEVIGVTFRLWKHEDGSDGAIDNRKCCLPESADDARRVSDMIGIPHYIMDFSDDFRKYVIEYFTNEYVSGKTPNPCISCNRYVKFDAFYKKAIAMGMDYIATGHYARIEKDEKTGEYLLKKSTFSQKDQTYALYNLNRTRLGNIIFPVGSYSKEAIRKIAGSLGLPVSGKPDSQEICFVPGNNYSEFIKKHISCTPSPGDIVTVHGEVVGRHDGLFHYTVGQRKGLGFAAGRPVYVVELDAGNNRVIVGDEEDIHGDELIARDMNFIPFPCLKEEMDVFAKIRYSAREASAVIYPEENGRVRVKFRERQKAITPGQSVVFYDGDVVVGGGVIERQVSTK